MAARISKDNISGQNSHVSTETADTYTRALLNPCQYIRTSSKLPTIKAIMIDHSEVSRVPMQRQARLDNPRNRTTAGSQARRASGRALAGLALAKIATYCI